MGCSCCLGYGGNLVVGDVTVNKHVLSVSLDSSLDVLENYCGGTDTSKVFGPKKITMQFSAYPFDDVAKYDLGLTCPVDISVQLQYKYVLDCSTPSPRWVCIPLKKKSIVVTGDAPSTCRFTDKIYEGLKFSAQAGPQPIFPRTSIFYSGMSYAGIPIPFDASSSSSGGDSQTKSPSFPIKITTTCSDAKLDSLSAKLTSFSFSFQPPAPPTVSYSFEVVMNKDGVLSLDNLDNIIDCSTVSISYSVAGSATISYTAYTKSTNPPVGFSFNKMFKNRIFKGYVTGLEMVGASDTAYNEWKVSVAVTS